MALNPENSQVSLLSDENSSSLIGGGPSIDKNTLENSTVNQACNNVNIYHNPTIIYQQEKSGSDKKSDEYFEESKVPSEQSSVSNATSSIADMKINQDTSKSSKKMKPTATKSWKKPTLRQVFPLYEGNTAVKYNALMAENKFDEAFGVMRKLLLLGAAYRGQLLVDFHRCSLHSDSCDYINDVRQELLSLIKENIDTTPQEIKKFADELREKSKHFDSILFYYLSGGLYRDATEPNLAVEQIENCAYGMKESIVAMLEADESLKSMVKHHVIPLITELKAMVLTIDGASEQARCLQSSWCDLRKEWCEDLVDDHEAREQTILDAVKSMQDCFGEKAKEYRLFGLLLNNLGRTYYRTSRYGEAAEYFELAINSFKLATDYQSSDAKTQDIKGIENNLRIMNEQLNK